MNKTTITIIIIAGAIVCNFLLFNFLKAQFADELAPLRESHINLILGSVTMTVMIVAMFLLIPRDKVDEKKIKKEEKLGV